MSSKRSSFKSRIGAVAAAACLAAAAGQAHATATIIINNLNAGTGIGFDDPTPAVAVGGNTGTTLGQQRLIAFTYAANLWGATLTSNQPIIINAQFSALTCSATTAVLGSAGATNIYANFANAPKSNTWYSYALANKISGVYQGTANAAQISANFNVNLGQANCLPGTFFYFGLDGNHGTNTDFVAVLQHEMAHGLGFQTFTNGSTGALNGSFPSIWDHFLYGVDAGKLWKDMTAAERVASSISLDKLVWTGANVNNAVPSVLRFGLAGAVISGPNAGNVAGTLRVGEAGWGAPLGNTPVVGQVMAVQDQVGQTGPGCDPYTSANATAVSGRIALVARGTCNFTVKAKNAQNAGAIAIIISDNVAEIAVAPSALGGSDPTVTIPGVRVFLNDGNRLREQLKFSSRTGSGVLASLGIVINQYAGADLQGRMQMYAPNPYQSGSSVSHYDVGAFRNQLMEPAINGDLTQSVMPPQDLTYMLFKDIGWEVSPPTAAQAAALRSRR